MPKTKKKNFTYARGRRKGASARVRLMKGKGETLVNEKPFEKYFPGITGKYLLERLLKTIDVKDKFYATIKVKGGGKVGQLDAVINGLAKAFVALDKEKYKLPLKKIGVLTRDARERERRKVGTGGKARRKKQSPKR